MKESGYGGTLKRFLNEPIVQKILLGLSILFVLDTGYRLLLEKSYYLQSAGSGVLYRINKKTGEVYLIRGAAMIRVDEHAGEMRGVDKPGGLFDKYKDRSSFFDREILGLEEPDRGLLYELGSFLAKDIGLYHVVPGYESKIPYRVTAALALYLYLASLILCPLLAIRKGREWLSWLAWTVLSSWIAIAVLAITKRKSGVVATQPLAPGEKDSA